MTEADVSQQTAWSLIWPEKTRSLSFPSNVSPAFPIELLWSLINPHWRETDSHTLTHTDSHTLTQSVQVKGGKQMLTVPILRLGKPEVHLEPIQLAASVFNFIAEPTWCWLTGSWYISIFRNEMKCKTVFYFSSLNPCFFFQHTSDRNKEQVCAGAQSRQWNESSLWCYTDTFVLRYETGWIHSPPHRTIELWQYQRCDQFPYFSY